MARATAYIQSKKKKKSVILYLCETKPIHNRQTHPLIRDDVTMTTRVQLEKKKISGHEPQGA
jgi:hypothetical protein